MYHLITIGDALVDTHVKIDNASINCDVNREHCHLCLDYASKVPIADSFQNLGGNAANVACGTTRLGFKTGIISTIGADTNGSLVLSELKKFDVDTEFVTADHKIKTRYAIVLNFKGERTILSYHARRQYRWPKIMPTTNWIYYSGVSEGFESLQKNLTKWLTQHPTVRVAYNPGSYQLKHALDSIKDFITHTDILFVNLEEAEKITGTTLKKEKNASALIRALVNIGTKEAVITDGDNGAWAGNKEDVWHLNSFPVQVVAKTGAGDAFASAYLAARTQNHNISTALQWGIASSSAVIQQFGAQNGLPNKKSLQKILKQYSNIKPVIV